MRILSLLVLVTSVLSLAAQGQPAAQPTILVVPGYIGNREVKGADGSCTRFFAPGGKTLIGLGQGQLAYQLRPGYVLVVVPAGVDLEMGFSSWNGATLTGPATMYGQGLPPTGGTSMTVASSDLATFGWYTSFFSSKEAYKASEDDKNLEKVRKDLKDVRKDVLTLSKKLKVDLKEADLAPVKGVEDKPDPKKGPEEKKEPEKKPAR